MKLVKTCSYSAVVLALGLAAGCGQALPEGQAQLEQPVSAEDSQSLSAKEDPNFEQAFESRLDGVQLKGRGEVYKLLADDLKGSRHQKFLVRLRSGQTLLVAHNIDLAPRIDALEVGDQVSFYGEYAWTDRGGVMHWTHHDPAGRHQHGWIKHEGVTYQ